MISEPEERIARWLSLGIHRQQPCDCADCYLMRGLAALVRQGIPAMERPPREFARELTVDV